MYRLGAKIPPAFPPMPPAPDPVVHGRLHPLGPGKDTITGHWELMGVVTPVALRTYPEGFPEEIVEQLIDGTGRGVLCNRPYSGIAVIEDFGEQHLETGDLIVYTSADSVLQIAAHEESFGLERLYEVCEIAFKLVEPYNIGRVIARPFVGANGNYTRTSNRHDYAVAPPAPTLARAPRQLTRRALVIGVSTGGPAALSVNAIAERMTSA